MKIDGARAEVENSGALIRGLAIGCQFQYVDFPGGQMRRGRCRGFFWQGLRDQGMQMAAHED
ncbi:hypothetical protein D3C85_1559260 [compost metagenome]